MIYGSVCSGIEAATNAWHSLGWEPAWFAEIEKFPSRALARRFPNVPNLGDMTKLHERDEFNVRTIDLLVGGTPCQSFSVAGLRKGMADPRGNLTLAFLGLLERKRPRWVVWENVPGVLSSWTGDEPPSDLEEGQEWEAEEKSDFGCFLAGLQELGYGFAYRVLDAQYFGLAQRRKRVFLVGYLGSWTRPAAVLFERESVPGNPPPSRESGKDVAPTLASRTRGGGGLGTDTELDGGLIAHTLRGEGFDASEDGTGRGTPLVPIAFSSKDFGADATNDLSPTLRAMNHDKSHMNGGGQIAIAFHNRQDPDSGPITHALGAKDNGLGVCFGHAVRRLTPRECERLQGFSDDYTLIERKRGPSADGPRYKAIGNSMAVPVMNWIGRRIQMFEELKR